MSFHLISFHLFCSLHYQLIIIRQCVCVCFPFPHPHLYLSSPSLLCMCLLDALFLSEIFFQSLVIFIRLLLIIIRFPHPCPYTPVPDHKACGVRRHPARRQGAPGLQGVRHRVHPETPGLLHGHSEGACAARTPTAVTRTWQHERTAQAIRPSPGPEEWPGGHGPRGRRQGHGPVDPRAVRPAPG